MPTNKQLVERWQNALRVLTSMSRHERKKHFDMGSFGYQSECGTVACAVGHCSLDPWFRRRGFSASINDDGELQLNHPPKELLFGRDEWGTACINFFGDGAAGIFFGRSCAAGFFPQTYRGVTAAIRKHIKVLQSTEEHKA